MPHDDYEEGSLGQWVFNGDSSQFVPLDEDSEPRRVGSGNTQWYREQLLRVRARADQLMRDPRTPPCDRLEAERTMERLRVLTLAVQAYEAEQRLQAEQGSTVVRYTRDTEGTSTHESERDEQRHCESE
jgi:hypothetical protein